MARCTYWRDNASSELRPRIEKMMQEFSAILAKLLYKSDYNGLRLNAIALQRHLGDMLGGQAQQGGLIGD